MDWKPKYVAAPADRAVPNIADAGSPWPDKLANEGWRQHESENTTRKLGESGDRDVCREKAGLRAAAGPLCHHVRGAPFTTLVDSRSSWYGWISWGMSVLLCSALLTALVGSNLFRKNVIIFDATRQMDGVRLVTAHPSLEFESASPLPLRRRGTCQSGGASIEEFNQPLRIGAVFIILVVSSMACAFPIAAARFPGIRMPASFFFAVRHFGTGVLIATAFVHLLPTAFTLLGDPCLSRFWTDDYPAMPGAIALAGIFIVTVIEMLLHPARGTPYEKAVASPPPQPGAESGQIASKRPLQGRQGSISRTISGIESSNRAQAQEDKIEAVGAFNGASDEETGSQHAGVVVLTLEQKHQKEIIHCLLLEMGILFHSVFIGMALSLSIDHNEFIVLLIAISFHQTFEGLALGARIAAITWPPKSLQPAIMAIAYGCTTPLGQAIGLAARSAYSPDSEVGLVLVGVMNALSAGLLVFASLVELLSEDLLSDESWRVLRGHHRVYAFLLVLAGAFGMSLVGAWA
ncbi:ZIP zinc transporter-domain-containing protein [Durotheca rogersii]|uniref:ZIP zinc transporter-domain-containing protein n=1 Tax=Durotheca rogersii TaxID=419775 RepID=UPI00221F16F9|nr:ZIP zinc transporter-domain-containing protein [Durotheca rogersii]KAI5866117.1 ZIP zinc transporter-domain-containing protein [Durotheca rogersii]